MIYGTRDSATDELAARIDRWRAIIQDATLADFDEGDFDEGERLEHPGMRPALVDADLVEDVLRDMFEVWRDLVSGTGHSIRCGTHRDCRDFPLLGGTCALDTITRMGTLDPEAFGGSDS